MSALLEEVQVVVGEGLLKRKSKPKVKLSDEELGRMITALRRPRTGVGPARQRSWGSTYYNSYRQTFSDEQIMAALNLDAATFKRVVPTYPSWTSEKIMKVVVDFARKEKRWPGEKDWGPKGGHGLPSRSTAARTLNWRMYERIVDSHFRRLTPQLILAIPNLTVRENAMTRYGTERLITKVGRLISEDKFGKLWELPKDSRDPRSLYCEVVNKSPEPDGSFKHYFLRVPPNMTCPQQAVHWTIPELEGTDWREFDFAIET